MKILAVTHRADKASLALLEKFIRSVFPEDKYPLEIIDIHTTQLPAELPELVFTFGKKATSTVDNSIEFPTISKLNKDTGSLQERAGAYALLLDTLATSQVVQPKPTKITASEFKQFSPEHLDKLREVLQEKDFLEVETDSGEKIRIVHTIPKDSQGYKYLTLAELFLVKFMIDKMEIGSVTLSPTLNKQKRR